MFRPTKNDHLPYARSKENGKYVVFVHPAEFLVAGPEKTILERTLLGDALVIAPDQAGSEADSKCVF